MTSPATTAVAVPAVRPGAAREARAGLAMSVATFAMATASAIQAVLYLSQFGTSGRTDGFFVAFALYTTIGVFSQSLRLTSVPLLVEPGARLTPVEFARALFLLAIPLMLAAGPLAGQVANVLAPGLSPADRAVTADALPALGAATVFQLWAAGAATILAVRGYFNGIAAAYIAGAVAGLATYLALASSAGELTLGWSMLAMGSVTLVCMLAALRASGGLKGSRPSAPVRASSKHVGLLLGRTVVYLAFNVLFVITLSFASHSTAGETTVVSYAYLFVSYLVAGTGMALGMSRISDMTRGARTERRAVVRETVPQGFRYSMLLVAPALAGLVTAGAPLIHELLPGSLSADGVSTLRVSAVLLGLWMVAALVVSFMLPAMFALERAKLVNLLALPLVLVHIGVTALGSAVAGLYGAIAACCVAPGIFAAVLLIVGGGSAAAPLAREMAGDAARFLALATVAFGGADLLVGRLTSGLAGSLFVAVLGGVLYVAGMFVVARRQAQVVLRTLRPAAATA